MSDESTAETGETDTVTVTVFDGETRTDLSVTPGRTLRDVLLEQDFSPYTRLTASANCGGRGLCATCGVRLRNGPPPKHWHDRLAARFGYPRLSCQETVEADLTVELVENKRIWGSRNSPEDDSR